MTKRKWAWVGICAMILFVAAGTLWSVYGKTDVRSRADLVRMLLGIPAFDRP